MKEKKKKERYSVFVQIKKKKKKKKRVLRISNALHMNAEMRHCRDFSSEADNIVNLKRDGQLEYLRGISLTLSSLYTGHSHIK